MTELRKRVNLKPAALFAAALLLSGSQSRGCTPFQTMRYVILPQAIRHILPPLGNRFVYMLKVSSLVSVIGLGELTRKASELTVIEYRPLEICTILIIEYLVGISKNCHYDIALRPRTFEKTLWCMASNAGAFIKWWFFDVPWCLFSPSPIWYVGWKKNLR